MGDFTGFSFGNWHSTDSETGEVKIVRVSNGDRYTEQLYPEINDRTVEVPGMDGHYYFGSNYGIKHIVIDFAFDHLTETQLRVFRQIFGTRDIQKLVFDETPYKYYLAKVADQIELSYVCFDERKRQLAPTTNGIRRDREHDYTSQTFEEVIEIPVGQIITYNLPPTLIENSLRVIGMDYTIEDDSLVFDGSEEETPISVTISYDYSVFIPQWEQIIPYKYENFTERIYKGEGKIDFVCYFPFAKSNFKVLRKEDQEIYKNYREWFPASGLLDDETYNYYYYDRYAIKDNLYVNPISSDFSITDVEIFKEKVESQGIYTFSYKYNDDIATWFLNNESVQLNEYGITARNSQIDDTYTIYYHQNNIINVYNAGDVSTGFRLFLSSDVVSQNIVISYIPYSGSNTTDQLLLAPMLMQPNEYLIIESPSGNPSEEGWYEFAYNNYKLTKDTQVNVNKTYYEGIKDIGVLIDTNTELIIGVKNIINFNGLNDTIELSGNLYNQYIDGGFFFKLKKNIDYHDGAQLVITNSDGDPIGDENSQIEIYYDYLYF